jgi:hypothetical protein
LVRLAEKNGFPTTRQAAQALGLEMTRLDGKDAIGILAAQCTASAVALSRSTPQLGADGITVAGQTFRRDQVASKFRRWCPQCLIDHPVHRFWFDISTISTCPAHGLRLRDCCPRCGDQVRWSFPSMTGCRCEQDESGEEKNDRRKLVALVEKPFEKASQREMQGDRYILGRLGVLAPVPVPLADECYLGDALACLQRLGMLSAGGRRHGPPSPDDLALSQAELVSSGIETLTDWPKSFSSLLDRLAADWEANGREGGAKSVYGWGFLWIARTLTKDVLGRAIRAETARHLRSILRTSRRVTTLDMESNAPRDYTLYEAADACDMMYRTMRRVCVALGLVPARMQRSGKHIVLSAQDVERIKSVLTDSSNLIGVGRALGLSMSTTRTFFKSGILQPWVKAGVGGLNAHIFRNEDVRDLLKKLAGDAPIVEVMPSGAKPLPLACKDARMQVRDGVRFVLERRVRPVGILLGRVGLSAVLLEVSDLQALFHEKIRSWWSTEKCAAEIGIHRPTCTELLRLGILKGVPKDPKSRSPWFVDPASVEQFKRDYVIGADLADAVSTTRICAPRRIIQLGVKPVVSVLNDFYSQTIFRRLDVERALAEMGTRAIWTREVRNQFWSGLFKQLVSWGIPKQLSDDPGQFVTFGVGKRGVNLFVRYNAREKLVSAGIILQPPTTVEQREEFMSHRAEIEEKAGFALQWRLHENSSRLVAEITNTDIPLNNRAGWEGLQGWTADMVVRLKGAAKPYWQPLLGARQWQRRYR